MKKLLLTLGAGAAALAPLASTIACGSGAESVKGGIALVAAEGSIEDQSFNQQAWEALKLVNTDAKASSNAFQPNTADASVLKRTINSAVDLGAETIVAPGFTMSEPIKAFNEEGGVNDANFVIIDDVPTGADGNEFSNVASITFDTQEAGFMAGYLASIYLEELGDTDPTIGMFGGGPFPGVTDFMVGVVSGVEHYNTHNAQANLVKFAMTSDNQNLTNTGFTPGGGSTISNTLLTAGADILMAVAGPQTADAADAIKASQRRDEVKLIGVDVDQSATLSDHADLFLTSILKNIRTMTEAVLNKVVNNQDSTGINGLGKTTVGNLANNGVGIAKNVDGATLVGSSTTTMSDLYDRAEDDTIKAAATAASGRTWENALGYMTTNKR